MFGQVVAAAEAMRARLVGEARAAGRQGRDAAHPSHDQRQQKIKTLRKAAERMMVQQSY